MNLDEAMKQLDEAPKKISLSPAEQKKLERTLLSISAIAKTASSFIKKGDSKATMDAIKTLETGMKVLDSILRR